MQSNLFQKIFLGGLVFLAIGWIPNTKAADEELTSLIRQHITAPGELWESGKPFHWCDFYVQAAGTCSEDMQCGRAGFCNTNKKCECFPDCKGAFYSEYYHRLRGKIVKCSQRLIQQNDAVCGKRGVCEMHQKELVCVCKPNSYFDLY